MYKNIVTDKAFLSLKAEDATKDDVETIGRELLATLLYHHDTCVGLAANMIGYNKKIICFIDEDDKMKLMFNPVITLKSDSYLTKEGCLCYKEEQPVTRYKRIKVEYLDTDWKKKIKTYYGFVAQIIQHEMDHLEGILI